MTSVPDWRCLGDVPRVLPRGGFRAEGIRALLIDGTSRQGVPGATVRACQFPTISCGASATSNAEGLAAVQLDGPTTSLAGAYDLLRVEQSGVIDPILAFVFPRLSQSNTIHGVIVNTVAEEDLYYASAGVTWDRSMGTVQMFFQSCGLAFMAPGVSLESTLGGQRFYFTPGLKSDVSLKETTAFSFGGFANVPPGVATITARLATNDGSQGRVVATFSVKVEPGVVTTATVYPAPEGGW